jgi:serine/threonine protein phosphatase PrpC
MVKNNIEEEVRRIYECGGEIRKLAGEEQSRIFVKGKYFPGLINTRSLGDQIGSQIGISSVPHISKYSFHEKFNYYLLICTDGISNVLKTENLKSTVENNDGCKVDLMF